jgi:hypothetical protein
MEKISYTECWRMKYYIESMRRGSLTVLVAPCLGTAFWNMMLIEDRWKWREDEEKGVSIS